jgi:hypothetical protein
VLRFEYSQYTFFGPQIQMRVSRCILVPTTIDSPRNCGCVIIGGRLVRYPLAFPHIGNTGRDSHHGELFVWFITSLITSEIKIIYEGKKQ